MADPQGPHLDLSDEDDTPLTFATSSAPENFGKTPANVKGKYLEVHHPTVAIPPSKTKKRKSVAIAEPSSSAKKPRNVNVPASSSKAPVTYAAPEASAAPVKTRTRDPNKKQGPQRIIPRSLEECDPADQALITMRDANKEWKEIREKYTELTGQTHAHSTLPNRYARLKSNFTILREADNPLLLTAKRQVEASFEAQKWDLVAQVVREKGGEVYAGCVLQRQYKKLMVQQGVGPPEGVRDADWEVEALL